MRSGLIAMVLGGSLFGMAGPAWAQKGKRGEQDAVNNGWLFSLSEAKAQAKKTGKPIMAVVRCVP